MWFTICVFCYAPIFYFIYVAHPSTCNTLHHPILFFMISRGARIHQLQNQLPPWNHWEVRKRIFFFEISSTWMATAKSIVSGAVASWSRSVMLLYSWCIPRYVQGGGDRKIEKSAPRQDREMCICVNVMCDLYFWLVLWLACTNFCKCDMCKYNIGYFLFDLLHFWK